ncbi:hypothetical protein W02_17880 [Nitrospira sp. KM1]|uniref:hypothetical protein n=1 Tax=Nitrospira sp. KM1 TaxID=1936990 RepID=UPI0013A790D0|nr:hypothetical protein [Nitrospira sp. KM1]BCA54648.1 hypothetical protein W02_17880 [Nitrospira sp. KM1]
MFTKGMKKLGGRKRGIPNKLTSNFRDAILLAYQDIGGHRAFAEWATENKTDFYKIAARLIPGEIRNSSDNEIRVIIARTVEEPNQIGTIQGEQRYLENDSL